MHRPYPTSLRLPRLSSCVAPAMRIVLPALAVGVACSGGGAADEDARVLATIDGEPIRMADVREVAGDQLDQLDFQYRQQRHRLIEAALTNAVRKRLLQEEADQRGVSLDELLAQATADVPEVTEADVADWYASNAGSLGGRALEDIRPQIKGFLEGRRKERALNDFTERLQQRREVRVLLDPFRVDVADDEAPALGPADAPVTLVEFSDFECPYCGRFFPTLKRLEKQYGDSLRIVYRHFPLDTHPHAFQAARASMCAHDQGRFWEMHDLLFQEQRKLALDDLREKAQRLSLDTAAFNACLESERHTDEIEEDVREGNRIGIDGTPAVFVNGVQVPGGAAPYNTMAQMIEDALARAGSD